MSVIIILIIIILLGIFIFSSITKKKGGYAPFFDITSINGFSTPVVGMHLKLPIPVLNANGIRFLVDYNRNYTFCVSSVIDTFDILEIVADPFEYIIKEYERTYPGAVVPTNGLSNNNTLFRVYCIDDFNTELQGQINQSNVNFDFGSILSDSNNCTPDFIAYVIGNIVDLSDS